MVAPIIPTLGFNVGHAVANLSDPGLTIMLDDLEYNMGCKRWRFNGLPYNLVGGSQYDLTIDAIATAMMRGGHCSTGLTLNGVHTNNATQSNVQVNLHDALETMVTDLEAAIDWDNLPEGAHLEIFVGNEEEDNIASNYGGAVSASEARSFLRTDLKAIATDLKVISPDHISFGYCTYDSVCQEWVTEVATNGWGDLDSLHMNVYRNSAYIMQSERSQAVLNFVMPLNNYGLDRFGYRRVSITELQSFHDGLNDTRWIKGNEGMCEYDIIRRCKLMDNYFPNIPHYYFAYDVSSSNWDFKIRAGGANNLGGSRRWRQFFTNKCTLVPQTNKKLFGMEQLIANPFTNEVTLDVFGWTGENSATRVVQTSGGVNGGRHMLITSTTNGNSDVFTNSSSSGGMQIPQNMVGLPILMAWWAKYDATNIPTGTGEASVSLATSAGTHQITQGSGNFLPTADWKRFWFVFKVTQANNITLRLWGKKQFLTTQGGVYYDNLLMTPLYNDLMLNQILDLHLTESLNTSSPYAHYEQEPSGSTYVEAMRWMPPPVRLSV